MAARTSVLSCEGQRRFRQVQRVGGARQGEKVPER